MCIRHHAVSCVYWSVVSLSCVVVYRSVKNAECRMQYMICSIQWRLPMCIIREDSLCFDMQHYAVWINNAHWLYYWKRSESAVYKSVHPQYFKHSALISSSMQCYCASAALYGQKITNAHARLCIDSSASAAALLEKITMQCTASTRSVSIIGEDYRVGDDSQGPSWLLSPLPIASFVTFHCVSIISLSASVFVDCHLYLIASINIIWLPLV